MKPVTVKNTVQSKPVTVCCIGDMHDDPRLPDKSRFEWIGKWCKDQNPDYLVQMGDWATFDSMSMHSIKGSVDFYNNPAWCADIDSLKESLGSFKAGLGGCRARKIMVEGNHENRALRYENLDPRLAGSLRNGWAALFKGWEIAEYGTYRFIDGVGFVHSPINAMGRAYGGKGGNNRVANEARFSIVHGHDHKLEFLSVAKIAAPPIQVMSVGCTLPHGHVESYAKLSLTGWWWGVVKLTLLDGQIIGHEAISMMQIEQMYGKRKLKRVA